MRGPPDFAQQPPARQHPAGVGYEHVEQAVFDGRQVHLHAARAAPGEPGGPPRPRRSGIHRPRRRAPSAPAAREAAQVGAHPGQQLAHAERLGQVVVGAGRPARRSCRLRRRAPTSTTMGTGRPAAHVADHLQPVAVGQAQVQHQQVGLARAGLGQPVAWRCRPRAPASLGLQRAAHEAAYLRLVLNDNGTGADGTWVIRTVSGRPWGGGRRGRVMVNSAPPPAALACRDLARGAPAPPPGRSPGRGPRPAWPTRPAPRVNFSNSSCSRPFSAAAGRAVVAHRQPQRRVRHLGADVNRRLRRTWQRFPTG